MALGPDNFNCTVSLRSIFCYQGDDIDDVLAGASEPYIWVFMVKIDGEGLRQDGNYLVGTPAMFMSPGSHGNIGGAIERGTRSIPPEVGTWNTSMKPIPIRVEDQELGSIPGTILCAAVLMEENLTPGDAVEAAHQSVINLIRSTVSGTLAGLGLAGLAADAAAEFGIALSDGTPLTIEQAGQRVLQRRLKPIQDLFRVASAAQAAVTVIDNLDLGGVIGTALDADKPMGTFVRMFSQAELAGTTAWAPFDIDGDRIELKQSMWNMPEWAYNLYGDAYAHHKWVRRDLPSSQRLQVTCCTREGSGGIYPVSRIGGVDGDVAWSMSRAEAAGAILDGTRSFFVVSPQGRTVEVEAHEGGSIQGRPWFYIQTAEDQDPTNNLVSLPSCGAGAGLIEVWY